MKTNTASKIIALAVLGALLAPWAASARPPPGHSHGRPQPAGYGQHHRPPQRPQAYRPQRPNHHHQAVTFWAPPPPPPVCYWGYYPPPPPPPPVYYYPCRPAFNIVLTF